jgi:tRNA-2-methylthio-N6-dimethylallyladenosine synthase
MKKLYIETYGCQMNVVDSEIVLSILKDSDIEMTSEMGEADIILVNTCAVREHAEQRVFGRLDVFRQHKKENQGKIIGVIGCMAERMKDTLLDQKYMVDMVVGPDAYRDLPLLLEQAENRQKAINVLLSREETYADINPVRLDRNKVSAFVSIMRGCNNMCSYCVVPFTRGRERSRSPQTIIHEISNLLEDGYKEVTLLGQNVDKYNWQDTKGTKKVNFAHLLDKVASLDDNLRVRFATSYPQDMTDEVLHVMADHDNVCKYIHLPVQSGSNRMLELMKRGYTREMYLDRISAIHKIVPECSISADFIAGFCSETEEDHQQTLSLMREVQFDYAYMFKYSERPNTYAARKLSDDVPEPVKGRRLQEIIDLQKSTSLQSNRNDVGKSFIVLAEGISKKSSDQLVGRNSQNKMIVFPKNNYKPGDYVRVKVANCTSATLIGMNE